jgi:transposase
MPGTKYSTEMRAKAVRLVVEHSGDYPSEWAAITEVSRRLGIGSAETLRKWVRQAEIDDGKKPGTSTAESAELRELRRKNRELEQTIAILTEATRFFARYLELSRQPGCDLRNRVVDMSPTDRLAA